MVLAPGVMLLGLGVMDRPPGVFEMEREPGVMERCGCWGNWEPMGPGVMCLEGAGLLARVSNGLILPGIGEGRPGEAGEW